MAAASESRVLRFFGVEEAEVRQAASRLTGRCGLTGIETRAQGAETLLALTAPPAGLRKAEALLGRAFRAGLYGTGSETLAACTARALTGHDRLLACADTLALDLLAPRLEGQPGIDACFDFGAGSCADPDALARIEAGARRCRGGGPAEPVWDELCRLRAALKVTRADFAAGALRHPYTRALLAAVPKLGGKGERPSTIPGHVPSPGEFPAGCRFFDRCARAAALPPELAQRCRNARPELREVSPGHSCACVAPFPGGEEE